QTGASAFDTATIGSQVSGFAASGTVTYNLYPNNSCTAPDSTSHPVTLSSGGVPNSNPTVALTAGSYSFQAVYGGDANYNGSTGGCEHFSVAKAGTSVTTTVLDNATSATWTNTWSASPTAYATDVLR